MSLHIGSVCAGASGRVWMCRAWREWSEATRIRQYRLTADMYDLAMVLCSSLELVWTGARPRGYPQPIQQLISMIILVEHNHCNQQVAVDLVKIKKGPYRGWFGFKSRA